MTLAINNSINHTAQNRTAQAKPRTKSQVAFKSGEYEILHNILTKTIPAEAESKQLHKLSIPKMVAYMSEKLEGTGLHIEPRKGWLAKLFPSAAKIKYTDVKNAQGELVGDLNFFRSDKKINKFRTIKYINGNGDNTKLVLRPDSTKSKAAPPVGEGVGAEVIQRVSGYDKNGSENYRFDL